MARWTYTGSTPATYLTDPPIQAVPGATIDFGDQNPPDTQWVPWSPPAPDPVDPADPDAELVPVQRATAGTAGFVDGTVYAWDTAGDVVEVRADHAAELLADPADYSVAAA